MEEVFRKGEHLVVVAVDFKKPYDSVKRGTLEILKEYRVAGDVIELFKRVYSEDRTMMDIDERSIEMEVESGIRQGCTASTVLFKLITYRIIEGLRRRMRGVRVGDEKVRILFYADDGLLLANSIGEAEEGIRELKRIGMR